MISSRVITIKNLLILIACSLKFAADAQVFQVRRKSTGQVYAMKVMRKERILARDHSDYVRAEREVLTAVFHPYIVTMRCSFQVRYIQLTNVLANCQHTLPCVL